MQAKIIDHGNLLYYSAFNHGKDFSGKTFGQFLILETFLIATTAVPNDQVYIVGRNIAAPHVAVIVALSVKWAYYLVIHNSLVCKNRQVHDSHGEVGGEGRHHSPDFGPCCKE
jgi:hypothetical protein